MRNNPLLEKLMMTFTVLIMLSNTIAATVRTNNATRLSIKSDTIFRRYHANKLTPRNSIAQSLSIYPTIGAYFIKGVGPLNDDIIADDPNAYYLDFYLINAYSGLIYDSNIDNTGGSGIRTWNYNMALLDTDWVFLAYSLDSNGDTLGGDYYWPYILDPDWDQPPFNGSINISNLSGSILSLNCWLPINAIATSEQVANTKGLIGENFTLSNATISFTTNFDLNTGNASSANPSLSVSMGALFNPILFTNQSFTGSISFDSKFNLAFAGTSIWSLNPVEKAFKFDNVPLVGLTVGSLFSAGGACVSANLGFKLQPKIKSKLVIGYDLSTGNWGFITDGSDATEVLGKVEAIANAQGEINLACASIFGYSMGFGNVARGRIDANLQVGGGVGHISYPNTTIPYFGVGLNINANLQVLGAGERGGEYSSVWGDSINNYRTLAYYKDDFLKLNAKTIRINSDFIPQAWTKGVMSARDSILAICWIDDINVVSGKSLCLTYYNPINNSFSSPFVVASNDSSIEMPTVSVLPSHKSIISWAQLNIPKSQIDTVNSSVDDILKKQDVWVAIYDPITASILNKVKLNDNTGTRPDGSPKVHWGYGNKGMLVWQVGDTLASGSKIYFSEITEIGSNYTFSTPAPIANLTGFNFCADVCYYNSTNAIAEWINDPDMDDSTNNSQVYYSYWNGVSWSLPTLRYNIPADTRIKEITVAVNGQYGVDGVTYEYYTPDMVLINGIYTSTWSGSNPSNVQTSWIEDSVFVFQNIKSAVSQDGFASFIYQTRHLTNNDPYGKLDLYINDLNYNIGWNYAAASPYVGDSTEFVWNMSSEFGFMSSANSINVMYLLTQEIDTLGNTQPSYGQVFGHPNLNQVLRAIDVSSNNGYITFSPLQTPSDTAIISYYQGLNSFNNSFELNQNYPNPFSLETYISFHLVKGGRVVLDLFDIKGELVATLLDTDLTIGDYETKVEAGGLECGIYYYRLSHNGISLYKKMVLTK